jgi:hypothetical protein
MLETMMHNGTVEETAEQKLWRAVIANTLDEWINGPLRQKREAEQFLLQDESDYRTVCFSAGIDPQDLRCRLQRIRSREAGKETQRFQG